MTIPYQSSGSGGEFLPSTDGVPTGYSLFYDASSGIAKWGQSSISTTGAQDNNILTYKSSTNKIVWSSPAINLKEFLQTTATPQLEGTFFGSAAGDRLHGCDITNDGDYIVLGYPNNNSNRGLVRVYKVTNRTTNTWTQVGGDIVGATTSSKLGKMVRIAKDDPTVIVVRTEEGGTVNTPDVGVWVYKYSNDAWATMHTYPLTAWVDSTVDTHWSISESIPNVVGVSISDDGTRVAMAHHKGDHRGNVAIYDYLNSAWTGTQIPHPNNVSGATFPDSANSGQAYPVNDGFGMRLALSGDGNTLACGFYKYMDNGSGSGRGGVRVIKYINSGWSWVNWGSSSTHQMRGEHSNSEFGSQVAISYDGNTVAASDPRKNLSAAAVGAINLYRYDNSVSTYVFEEEFTAHFTPNGGGQGQQLGWTGDGDIHQTLALSSNGFRLIVGSPTSSGLPSSSLTYMGQVFVYNKDSNNVWSIDGNYTWSGGSFGSGTFGNGGTGASTFINIVSDAEAGARFGGVVGFSKDATRLIVTGFKDDNTVGLDAGVAKVYTLPVALSSGSIYYGSDSILRIQP